MTVNRNSTSLLPVNQPGMARPIRLLEARSAPEIALEINGDGEATTTDALGNPSGAASPDRDDVLYGNNQPGRGEKISGLGGNDRILADRPFGAADNGLGNSDWVLGGAGRDDIDAGPGNDLVEAGTDGVYNGETGGDLVYGGASSKGSSR